MKKKLKWIIPVVITAAILTSFLTQTIHSERILKMEKGRAQALAETFLNGVLAGDPQVLDLMKNNGEWSEFRRGYNEAKIANISEDIKSSEVDQGTEVNIVEFSPMKLDGGTVWFFIVSILYADDHGIRMNGMLIPDQEEEFITYFYYWNVENRIEFQMGEDREWIY